jgi:O-antigen/teichoic acid export membrane protein
VILAFRGTAEIVALALNALTGILVSRAIGPTQFGYFALVWTLVQVGSLLVGFGTATAGAQRIANDSTAGRVTWWSVVLARVVIMAVVCPLGWLGLELAPIDVELRQMATLGLLAVVVQPFRVEWLLLGLGRPGVLAVLRVVSTAGGLALAILLVRGPADASIATVVIVAQAIGLVAIGTLAAIRFIAPFDREALKAGIGGIGQIFRSGRTYVRHETSVFIYTSSDRLFLFVFATPTVLGLYDAAYRIIQPLYAVSAVVGDTMYSELARAFGTTSFARVFRRYVGLMSFGTIPFGFFCVASAPWVMTVVYGDRFAAGADYLRVLGGVITLGYVAGIAIMPMAAWNRPREFASGVTWGGISALALNTVLIPSFGGLGAALATIGANGVTVILGLRNFRRVVTYPLVADVSPYAIAATAALAVALVVNIAASLLGVVAFGITYALLASPSFVRSIAPHNEQRGLPRPE